MIKKHIEIQLTTNDMIIAIVRGERLEKEREFFFLKRGYDFTTIVSKNKLKFKHLSGNIYREYITYRLEI